MDLLVGSVIGFILGIPAGVIGNYFFRLWSESQAKAELMSKYGSIAGEYNAYGYKTDNPEAINYDDLRAKVTITYEKENILRFRHQETNHDHVWEAVIWMETPSFGTMAFRYTRLFGRDSPDEHRYGFKRCIVLKGKGRTGEPRWFMYLEGERPFGKEALEKNE